MGNPEEAILTIKFMWPELHYDRATAAAAVCGGVGRPVAPATPTIPVPAGPVTFRPPPPSHAPYRCEPVAGRLTLIPREYFPWPPVPWLGQRTVKIVPAGLKVLTAHLSAERAGEMWELCLMGRFPSHSSAAWYEFVVVTAVRIKTHGLIGNRCLHRPHIEASPRPPENTTCSLSWASDLRNSYKQLRVPDGPHVLETHRRRVKPKLEPSLPPSREPHTGKLSGASDRLENYEVNRPLTLFVKPGAMAIL
ncbi:hypothetical protein Bbelb_128550 [Branchiostoma belcheri]|nr:hypothetical protein Bbelb_128550 [Branchiostoma belcheri]